MGLITVVWVVWGFSLCFGGSNTFLGSPRSFYFMQNINGDPLPHQGKDKEGEAFVEGIPGLVFAGGMVALLIHPSVKLTWSLLLLARTHASFYGRLSTHVILARRR